MPGLGLLLRKMSSGTRSKFLSDIFVGAPYGGYEVARYPLLALIAMPGAPK
jgi:hypothetical protein